MYILILMNSILLSMIFITMNHPISLGFILLLQTISIALLSSFLTYSFWLSYILFLIMVGGMLILFTYITSIASNETFLFSSKYIIGMISFTMIVFFMMKTFDSTLWAQTFKLNEMNLLDSIMNLFSENTIMLNKIYNKPSNSISLILINYLFLTLIIAVKITNIKSGPLRQKF